MHLLSLEITLHVNERELFINRSSCHPVGFQAIPHALGEPSHHWLPCTYNPLSTQD